MSSSSNARQVLIPLGASRKRKERDGFDALRPPTITTKAEPGSSSPAHLGAAAGGSGGGNSNRLLAGYLAHEFLTTGTLFGQRWDPARPAGARDTEPARPKAYADVAYLLKTDGAHIPGIVNPTQLARWLQM